MSHVLYAYIAKPTTTQVDRFLRALSDHGVFISHLGKSDPPRRFHGCVEEAVALIFRGTDFTNWTFARDAARKLDFDIQIHHAPQWTHSTVSASCPDTAALGSIVASATTAFDVFIAIRGVAGGGKNQPWQVVSSPSENCPDDLRARFVR
jgi:hypothetical protein